MRNRPHSLRVPLIGFAILFAVAPASARRLLLGTVTDSEGKPLDDVKVTLFDVGGPAPSYNMDRSAVNAEGAGSEAFRAGSNRSLSEEHGAPEEGRELLKELTTDDKGGFKFNTHHDVDSLLVRLERPGYQTEKVTLGFPLGTTKRSFALRKTGETAEGEAGAGAAKGDDERAVARFEAGVALMRQKDWAGGRAAFTEAVQLKPDLDNAWLNLAIANFQLGDFAAGLAAAETLLELKPEHPVGKMMVADAKARLAAGASTTAGDPPRDKNRE